MRMQGSALESLSGGQNSISKTLLLAKQTFFHIKITVNRVKHYLSGGQKG